MPISTSQEFIDFIKDPNSSMDEDLKHYIENASLEEMNSQGNCVVKQENMKGMNPANAFVPIAKGKIAQEMERYIKAEEYEKQSGTKVLKKVAIVNIKTLVNSLTQNQGRI